MKYFLKKLLFFILLIYIHSYKILKKEKCERSKSIVIDWPQKINEKIYSFSSQPNCIYSTSTCRSHNEILDLAFCKSSKLSSMLQENKDLYYVFTWYKANSISEISKFIFAIIETNKGTGVSYTGDMQFIKICVPVDNRKKVIIDEKCPLDDCEENNSFRISNSCKKQIASNMVKNEFENMMKNISTIKK